MTPFRQGIIPVRRLPSLGYRQGPHPARQEGSGHAGQDKTRQYRDREDIFFYFLACRRFLDAKDDVLHLVVDSSASPKWDGLRVGREIMEVCLEEPKSLSRYE